MGFAGTCFQKAVQLSKGDVEAVNEKARKREQCYRHCHYCYGIRYRDSCISYNGRLNEHPSRGNFKSPFLSYPTSTSRSLHRISGLSIACDNSLSSYQIPASSVSSSRPRLSLFHVVVVVLTIVVAAVVTSRAHQTIIPFAGEKSTQPPKPPNKHSPPLSSKEIRH